MIIAENSGELIQAFAAIREVVEPQNQPATTIDEGKLTLKTQLGYFMRSIPTPDKIRGADRCDQVRAWFRRLVKGKANDDDEIFKAESESSNHFDWTTKFGRERRLSC